MSDISDAESIGSWDVRPFFSARSQVPFRAVLRTPVEAEFSGAEICALLATLVHDNPGLAGFINADAPESGAPLARPGLIFEQPSHWIVSLFGTQTTRPVRALKIPRALFDFDAVRGVLGTARTAATLDPGVAGRDQSSSTGAFIRREHASVEVAAASGTRVLFDPIFRSTWPKFSVAMPPPLPGIDAAFVTHSHYDHFDVATLDYLAARGTKIFIPAVPHSSILSSDMSTVLQMCDLTSTSCAWGNITEVGDIRVQALPFLGEQPSALVAPVDDRARNWGNCYRVDTPGFSALLLTDTGTDPTGSVVEAIAESVRQCGAIDIVIGCLRSLSSPFEVAGLPHDYAVLPFGGLRSDLELYRSRRLPSTTLGVSGIAQACVTAQAAFFLPYAHGLTGYRQPIAANPFGPGPGVDEATACRELTGELARIGSNTSVISWNPGDRWIPPARVN